MCCRTSRRAQFIEQQLAAFRRTIATVDLQRAPLPRTSRRTTSSSSARWSSARSGCRPSAPLAAAVIWNRLHLRMPLQIDATVEYALPVYKTQLTYQDLKIAVPLQHVSPRGPAAHAHRQPRDSPRCRRPRIPPGSTISTTSPATTAAAATTCRPATHSSSKTRRAPSSSAALVRRGCRQDVAPRCATSRWSATAAVPAPGGAVKISGTTRLTRHHRLAGGPLTLAGHAQRRVRGAGHRHGLLPLPVPAGAVGEAVEGLRALGFRGANVTMPHKAAVLPFLDDVSDDARPDRRGQHDRRRRRSAARLQHRRRRVRAGAARGRARAAGRRLRPRARSRRRRPRRCPRPARAKV